MRIHQTNLFTCVFAALVLFTSCSKNSDGGSNNSSNAPFWKGYVNTQIWEHGAILGTNGQIRYYFSDTGGSMSDTANANVQKYNGTYTTPAGTDSIYINCSNSSVAFSMRGKYNSAKTTISGIWKMSFFGITNTLPFSMSYKQ